jgi:hypothetical protein
VSAVTVVDRRQEYAAKLVSRHDYCPLTHVAQIRAGLSVQADLLFRFRLIDRFKRMEART